jgi:5-methylcytosine-specific restriction enzyme B
MATYMLTWNPSKFPWDGLAKEADQCDAGVPVPRRWSVAHSSMPKPGDCFLLLPQGKKGRGIIGKGVITSLPEPGKHYAEARK